MSVLFDCSSCLLVPIRAKGQTSVVLFRAEKRSAQASAHPLSQAQGGLFCVLTVFVSGLFVAGVLSEMHEVRTFAPCKAFLFDMFAFFSSLENYFGFRTTNVKGKMDHSVSLRWNKRF